MHHQRSACAATTTTNIDQPKAGMKLRCSTIGSTRQPTSRLKCRTTIAGSRPAPSSTPPWVLLTVRLRSATRTSISRSTATATTNNAYQIIAVSPPAQHDELGAEAGTHREHDSRAAARRLLGDRVPEEVQHRRQREVTDFTQRPPRQFQGVGR